MITDLHSPLIPHPLKPHCHSNPTATQTLLPLWPHPLKPYCHSNPQTTSSDEHTNALMLITGTQSARVSHIFHTRSHACPHNPPAPSPQLLHTATDNRRHITCTPRRGSKYS